jgi:hypothetical protein
MCLRDLNHVNTFAKGHANFESLFYVFWFNQSFFIVVSVFLMGHVALGPSFLFCQFSLGQIVEFYFFVALNKFSLSNLSFHL